jgi:hypothetical protein
MRSMPKRLNGPLGWIGGLYRRKTNTNFKFGYPGTTGG